MSGLIISNRYNQQPQQPAPVDPVYFGTAAKNVSYPASLLAVGVFSGVACEVRASRAGMAWVGNGSSSQRITSAVNGYPFTVIGSVVARDVTTNRVFTTVGAVAGTSHRVQIDVNAGTLRAIAVGSSTQTQTVSVAINQVLNFVFVGDSATSRRLYLNGRLVSTNTTSCTFSDTFTTIAINCGANATFPNGSQFIDGDTALNVVAQVALSDARARELSTNPWAMFQAPPRMLWLEATASTGTNVNPGAGTVAIQGYAPTVTRTANQSLAPAAGAVVIQGYAPTVTQSTTSSLTPAAGTVAIAGYAPTVTRTANQFIAPAAGSVAIVGYAPTITQLPAGVIRPSPGVVAIQGYAPTVTRTANQNLAPTPGAVTLTGYAPTLYQGPAVQAPQFYLTTIMRRSTITLSGSMANTAVNLNGTMAGALSLTTIMRLSSIRLTGSISSDPINLSADLL